MRCREQLLSAVGRSSKEQADCDDSHGSSGSTPRATSATGAGLGGANANRCGTKAFCVVTGPGGLTPETTA